MNIYQLTKFFVKHKLLNRTHFQSSVYARHNQRRLEHLASLNLPVHGATVLEVGAGVGDHTEFFLDRACRVVVTEGRKENILILRKRYPDLDVRTLDIDDPKGMSGEKFDIVYCYGLLYHLKKPDVAIMFMSSVCSKMLFLETRVSFGNEDTVNLCDEFKYESTQSISGMGCRPTRVWVANQLKKYFEHVYFPVTQPNHEHFIVDWKTKPEGDSSIRAVFIASRDSIENELLTEDIPMVQKISH